jgi:RNA recognition motif-containing protein
METGEDAVTQNKRVYVGNLSWSVTWRDLKDHMRSAGEVTRADVLQGYDGRSKGCGIVEYATVEEANTAVETLNDSELMGRQIFAREDREEKGANANTGGGASGGAKSSGSGSGDGKSVYVGNLAYEVAWQDLKDHMRSVGDVLHAEVMTMHDGRSKGCGIVEFATPDGAKKAIAELNDTELQGRNIFVREDRERGGAPNSQGGQQKREGDGGYQGGWQQQQHQHNRGGGGGGRGGNNNYGNLSVYVGNLAYETSWQDLKDHMRAAGNVDKVR